MEGKTSIDQDNASWITRSSSVYKTVWSNQRSGTYANLICTTNRGRGQLCQGWPASFPESFQVHTSIDVFLSPSLSLSLCECVCVCVCDSDAFVPLWRWTVAQLSTIERAFTMSGQPLPPPPPSPPDSSTSACFFRGNSKLFALVSNANFRRREFGQTHSTRACLRLIGNKIKNGDIYRTYV